MIFDQIAERAHESESTAMCWHTLHAAVAFAGIVLAVGELWYHCWAAWFHAGRME